MEELTVENAHTAFLAGTFTSQQLVQHYLDRIAVLDKSGPRINSILAISTTALSEADALDTFLADTKHFTGPLHGIPVLVKDHIATKDLATTFGSIAGKENIPKKDATVVKKLKEAGAVVIGKTTLPDWGSVFNSASSLSGLTRNPYDLRRDVGGSSSGTAASIAADFAILGLGEDTCGSIRVPASFCGLVGLRPTPGMISRHRSAPILIHQDTPGPMCRTVRDAALMFDAMVGFDVNDPYTTAAVVAGKPVGRSYASNLSDESIRTARLGVVRSLFGAESDPEFQPVSFVANKALTALEASGTILIDVEIPDLHNLLASTQISRTHWMVDADAFLKEETNLKTTIKEIYARKAHSPALDVVEIIDDDSSTLSRDPDFAEKILKQVELQRLIMSFMAQYNLDALSFPTCKIAAPLSSDILDLRWRGKEFPTNTLLASQACLPAISVPVGLTNDGLPVGLELVSYQFKEQLLFELAYGIERILKARRPPRLRLGTMH